MAILRFENVGPDPADDWMGRAFSEILTAQLAGAASISAIPSNHLHGLDRTLGARPISAPGISAERTAAILSGATVIGYGDYFEQAGKLRVNLTLRDPRTLKAVQTIAVVVPAGEVLRAAGEIARRIAPRSAPYGTANRAAVRDYVDALETGNGDAAIALAQQAVAADPRFGEPYVLLANAWLQQGNRAGALAMLDRARPADPAERARIELERATLRNDAPGRRVALEALVKATPGDLEAWSGLAEVCYTLRQYSEAVKAYQKAQAIDPDNGNVLNELGYAAAYSGNLELALSTLRRYATLRPKDPNPLDSTGDVLLMAGRLEDATNSYLAAARLDPSFQGGADLLKAAFSRVLAGDMARANEFDRQYVAARAAAHDTSAPVYAAQWLWLTGRHQEAWRALNAFAKSNETGPTHEAASRAYSNLAMWSLLSGDRDTAAQLAQKAAAANGPATAADAILARFLAQPSAPAAEWTARAAQLFRSPAQETLRQEVLSYALLLDKQFAPAADTLQRLYAAAGPAAGEGIPVLLAWAYVETGRIPEAAPLLRADPIPPAAINLFTPLYFPRLYQLRAQVAESEGHRDEAEKDRALYRELSASR